MKQTDSKSRRKRPALLGPAIPATYLRQVVELGRSWGLSEEQMLQGTRIPAELLHKRTARIPAEQSALLGLNILRLGGKPGFGFELGLNIKLTSHGPLGYALLSAATLREAANLAYRYARSRWGALQLQPLEDGDMTTVRIVETLTLGPFRTMIHEAVLTLLWRHACFVTGIENKECEFFFPWPEPDYFADYRQRLPAVHWSQAETLIRFPTRQLDRPLVSADASATAHALEEVERELTVLEETPGHFVERVRAALKPGEDGFPTLEDVAGRLFASDRSLKRKLQAAGTSFQKLLNDALQREAVRLMLNPDLDLQQISTRLGYQDPESFTRAFRRWTGRVPSAYRQQVMRASDD